MLTRCHVPILPPWKGENFFDLALLAHTNRRLLRHQAYRLEAHDFRLLAFSKLEGERWSNGAPPVSGVERPRPGSGEKSFEPIFPMAWNKVGVQMRDALADAIVDRENLGLPRPANKFSAVTASVTPA